MKKAPPLLFICHASEDKTTFVRELADALSASGLSVWYDEFSLRPGDSLRESIDRGLALCRHAIVVFSPAFFAKSWTQWELNGLVQRHLANDRDIIIPVWLGVDAEVVRRHSPPLADIVAYRAEHGVASLVSFLSQTVSSVDANSTPPLNSVVRGLSASAAAIITDALKSWRDLAAMALAISDEDIQCTLMLIDGAGDALSLVRGPTTLESAGQIRRVSLRSSLSGLIFSEQKTVHYDTNLWNFKPYEHTSHDCAWHYSSVIAVPVSAPTARGIERLGVISVSFKQTLPESCMTPLFNSLKSLSSVCAALIHADNNEYNGT
jgi:hypothetical protein